jgi:1-aminocyclopropane-1-carboxylate deaminase
MFDVSKSLLQTLVLKKLNTQNIELFVKRDDLIDEYVSGNKWRKLKYNVELAKTLKKSGILTFGGAYSNHLVATAAACHKSGLKAIGIVRGDELTTTSNSILRQCADFGMELQFVSRLDYAARNEKSYHEELNIEFPNYLIVPEGGANYYGMIGCQEILKETANDFDYVVVAQGTTTTSIGLALALPEKTTLIVVPVLKEFDARTEMKTLLGYTGFELSMIDDVLSKVLVLSEYHFGGYGKYTNELLDFMEQVYAETKLPLDPIYTGKALFALQEWVVKNAIQDKRILFIHTGGIQGGKTIEKKEGRRFSE